MSSDLMNQKSSTNIIPYIDELNDSEKMPELVHLVKNVANQLIHELQVSTPLSISERCRQLASSPDNEMVLTVGEETLNLWEDLTGKVVRIVKEEQSLMKEISEPLLKSCAAAMILPEVPRVQNLQQRHVEKLENLLEHPKTAH